MKRLRWQILVVLLALVAIAILLVSQQPVTLSPGVEPVAVQPATGGIYTEALVGQFGRLNPVLDYYNEADRAVNRLLYSSLLRFDDRGVAHGDLAENWGISQDGSVYNFSIRTGATWHDGSPVVSDDILFTVDLLRQDAIPLPADQREFWQTVSVIALDEQTLQFRLPEPFAPFLDYLTFGVVPSHLLQGIPAENLPDDIFNHQPIGSGPYRFERFIVEEGLIQGVVLGVNPQYYAQPAFIEQIIFRYYPDAQAAMQAYLAGQVQGISQISDEILSQALNAPNLNLYTGRIPRLVLLYLNLDNPDVMALQDIEVRRALLQGLNRQWMIDRLLGGQALPAHSPIFPNTWAYYDGIEQVQYDPEAATQALIDAGFALQDGSNVRLREEDRLEFDLVYPDEAPYQEVAKAVQRDWERLGVGINLLPVSPSTLMDDYLEPRTYQIALAEIDLSRSPDPDPYPFWHQTQITSGQNYSGWNDRQASELLEQARTLVDEPERTRRYRSFQARFASQLPALLLYYPVYTYGVDAQVQGVSMGPLYDSSDRFGTVTDWFLVIKRSTNLSQP